MEKVLNILFIFMIGFFLAAWYETPNIGTSILTGTAIFFFIKAIFYDQFQKLTFILQPLVMAELILVLHILTYVV